VSDELRGRVEALEATVASIEARLQAAALVVYGAEAVEPRDEVAAAFTRFRERARRQGAQA